MSSPAASAQLSALGELQELLRAAHDPRLAAENSVYQLWDDGEVTDQKAGELLWQRTLHGVYPPLPFGVPVAVADMPVSHLGGKHGYAFVTKENALRLRSLMCRAAGKPDPCRVDDEIEDDRAAAEAGLAHDPRSVIERIAAANIRKYEGTPPDAAPAAKSE